MRGGRSIFPTVSRTLGIKGFNTSGKQARTRQLHSSRMAHSGWLILRGPEKQEVCPLSAARRCSLRIGNDAWQIWPRQRRTHHLNQVDSSKSTTATAAGMFLCL